MMPSFFSYLNKPANNELPSDLQGGFRDYMKNSSVLYAESLTGDYSYTRKMREILAHKDMKRIIYSPKGNVLARFELRDINQSPDKDGEFYENFILTSIRQEKREIASVYPAFDQDILLTFGREPRYYQITGVLMNLSGGGDWIKQFAEMYDSEYRAEKLVRNGKILYLWYGSTVKKGYLLSLNIVEDGSNRNASQFSCTMYVVDELYFETEDQWSYYEVSRINKYNPLTGKFE